MISFVITWWIINEFEKLISFLSRFFSSMIDTGMLHRVTFLVLETPAKSAEDRGRFLFITLVRSLILFICSYTHFRMPFQCLLWNSERWLAESPLCNPRRTRTLVTGPDDRIERRVPYTVWPRARPVTSFCHTPPELFDGQNHKPRFVKNKTRWTTFLFFLS